MVIIRLNLKGSSCYSTFNDRIKGIVSAVSSNDGKEYEILHIRHTDFTFSRVEVCMVLGFTHHEECKDAGDLLYYPGGTPEQVLKRFTDPSFDFTRLSIQSLHLEQVKDIWQRMT